MADAEDNTFVLTFKYRLLPTKVQHSALTEICESQRILYNAALQERIDCYRKTGKSISRVDQYNSLTELRKAKEFATTPTNLQRWTIRRLDNSYAGFFRRLKMKGIKAGFPRYRSKGRWKSFGFAEFSGITIHGNRLRFRGLPRSLRVHLHRPLPDGKILSCTFTRDQKGWQVCMQFRIPIAEMAVINSQIGIDMGLTTLAMLSSGEAIPNPRVAQRVEKELRRRQRAMSRCKTGSNRRRKVKARVTRLYAKIKNTRSTYLHKISARLVRENDLIAVENLNVKGMASGMLAKSVNDAGWSMLKEMIAYKAVKAGRQFVEVNAAGTSQTCPECGQVKAKMLAERVHRCDCGCVMDRDHAAAIIVLQRAVVSSVAA